MANETSPATAAAAATPADQRVLLWNGSAWVGYGSNLTAEQAAKMKAMLEDRKKLAAVQAMSVATLPAAPGSAAVTAAGLAPQPQPPTP